MGLTYITVDGDPLSACLLNLFDHGVGTNMVINYMHRDMHTRSRKIERNSTAQPGIRAGDQSAVA